MMNGGGRELLPFDYNEVYPEVHGYLARPLLAKVPLASMLEVHRSMTLHELELLHQIMDIREHAMASGEEEDNARQGIA